MTWSSLKSSVFVLLLPGVIDMRKKAIALIEIPIFSPQISLGTLFRTRARFSIH